MEFKHYITIDEYNRIINGFSTAFQEPKDGDICIKEEAGYHFRFSPNGEQNPLLFEENGVPLYKYVDGTIILRSEEEISEDRAKIVVEPTMNERITELEAQNEMLMLCLLEMSELVYA